MRRLPILLVALLILVAGILQLTAQTKISDEQRKKIAAITDDVDMAPDFTLLDVKTDSTITLSELKGKVVLVNFWATWCYPCRLEIPDFNEVYQKYADQGVEILGISVSDQKQSLENFMKSYQINYPILFGSPTELSKITMQYGGVGAVPTTFMIGRSGEVVRSYPGAVLKGQPIYYDFIQTLERELKKEG